ncbi:hypothetical protein O0880_27555 [Janthinobacterium sp. SUN118]|uniref:hypothetical protein n=1 Tax=Janthinobacterium sp. SUN118 TaxID=3004100 RepID=UPI0025AFB5BE|nr:hypothetical protein [Janthinobacterium sp. SUN118]MDN2713180.1 hypothetical protein [Janthinobacterium sp. SUN118]
MRFSLNVVPARAGDAVHLTPAAAICQYGSARMGCVYRARNGVLRRVFFTFLDLRAFSGRARFKRRRIENFR